MRNINHQTKIFAKQKHKSDLCSHSRDPCPAASSRDAGQENQGEKAQEAAGADIYLQDQQSHVDFAGC